MCADLIHFGKSRAANLGWTGTRVR
jgi:hypothetical protein